MSYGRHIFALALAFLIVPCGHYCLVSAQEAQEPAAKRSVRDVTPPGIIRVYGAPEDATKAGRSKEGARRFDRVAVLPNGRLRSGNITIELQGIVVPDSRKICTSSSGVRWVCGLSAVGALRTLVHSRTLTCNVMTETPTQVLAECKVGDTEIGSWMLRAGWATPGNGIDTKDYLEAAAAAKRAGAGIWSNGPVS